jgi:uncharacterized NAD-dependent epimerase/dehydratase family protein
MSGFSKGSVIAKPDGNAIVWCEGNFDTPNGKTAHGLVRRTARYRVLAVIDEHLAGRDTGEQLDRKPNGIRLVRYLDSALGGARAAGIAVTHFVIGVAPDGGRLPVNGRGAVLDAIEHGLHVDSGLHEYLSDDPDIAQMAKHAGVTLRDVRKPPPRDKLHFFSGKISEVGAVGIAVLGTDSAVGKRTTAWLLVDALEAAGVTARLVGTGQTAWLQGVKHGLVLDSLVNDFVAGEIEHATWSAWRDGHPAAIVLEGQGSLMNPAYPGGFELLAASRARCVVMQHAPARKEYDGFPGYPLHPLPQQIRAIELVSGRPVAAITVNHEHLTNAQAEAACRAIRQETGLPAHDVLLEGGGGLVASLAPRLDALRSGASSAATPAPARTG